MGRFVLVVAVLGLAGCASHTATGPAWPKSHAADKDADGDGGESIEPRVVRPVEAAIDKTEEEAKPAPVPAAPTPVAPAPIKDVGAPAPAGAPAAPAVEETITTEDIVIEIDD